MRTDDDDSDWKKRTRNKRRVRKKEIEEEKMLHPLLHYLLFKWTRLTPFSNLDEDLDYFLMILLPSND